MCAGWKNRQALLVELMGLLIWLSELRMLSELRVQTRSKSASICTHLRFPFPTLSEILFPRAGRAGAIFGSRAIAKGPDYLMTSALQLQNVAATPETGAAAPKVQPQAVSAL